MRKEIINWYDAISDHTMFKHWFRNSHLFSRHMADVSNKELQDRIVKKRSSYGQIVSYSRFTDGQEEVIDMVLECIKENFKELEEFDKANGSHVRSISKEYDHPIGEGFVKDTYWGEPMKMYRIEVVLVKTENSTVPFYVQSAYPNFAFDQVDDVLDEIENYRNRPKRY